MDIRRNYQKELERSISEFESRGVRPSVLLHSCCAPCSSYVLEYLLKHFRITVFYYNPNIEPEEEYFFRLAEQKRLAEEMAGPGVLEVIGGDYEPDRFHETVRGLEREPEGGRRCRECFRLRLYWTAHLAAERGFDLFTTTLTISPYKNAPMLNEVGEEAARKYGVPFLNSDFKKKGGYRRSIELSEQYGLYRQDYCGCVYSRRGKE